MEKKIVKRSKKTVASSLEKRIDRLEQKVKALEEKEKIAPPPVRELHYIQPPPVRKISPSPTEKPRDWEMEIGSNWLSWIGIFILFLGVSFFLKYAFENHWINETVRVIIGVISGFILIGAGEKSKYKYRNFTLVLCGIGISILYLSIYTANNFYNLIPFYSAFGFMVSVTGLSIFLTLRHDSLFLALTAVSGGFLSPLILQGGEVSALTVLINLFTYIAVLDLGILTLANFKNWRILNALSFVFTAVIFTWWRSSFYTSELFMPTFYYLLLFFPIFTSIPIIGSIRKKTKEVDLFIVIGSAFFFSFFLFSLLRIKAPQFLGLSAAILAFIYLCLGGLIKNRRKEDKYLALTLLGMGVVFLTLVFPLQLKRYSITIAWAVESVVLMWIGIKIPSRGARVGSFIVLALTIFRLFAFDSYLTGAEFLVFLNRRVMSYLIVIGSIAISTWLMSKNKEKLKSDELSLLVPMIIFANFLVLFLLSKEAYDYFKYIISSNKQLWIMHQFVLTLIWALYGGIMILVGFVKKFKPLRTFALVIFGITILKVFFYDLSRVATVYRIIAFLFLGVLFVLVSFIYQRQRAPKLKK